MEGADEWLEEQEEIANLAGKPADILPAPQNSLPVAGENMVNSRKIDGAETGSTKHIPFSPPSSSLPATSSPPTAQPTTPTQPSSSSVPAASGVVGGESPPTAQPTAPLAVPPGVQRAPIAAIDKFIRDGYIEQDALEEIMKFNFHGRAYRKEVSQRRALYEARQPPFNDIPADFGGGVVGGGGGGGGVGGVDGETSENTRVLGPSPPTTQPTISASSPPTTPPTTGTDPFAAARNAPDAEAWQSVKNTLEPDALKHAVTVIKRSSRANFECNSAS